MAFPAGPLPTATHLQDLYAAGIPSKSLQFTHGGSDVDITDPANKLDPVAMGFRAGGTGNLVAQLAGDSSTRTFAVTAGQVVPGAFVLISATSTVDGVILGRH